MSERDDIGGNAAEKTERGFSIYGRVTDERGTVVRVQRSSACGEPCCHVFTSYANGRTFEPSIVGYEGGIAVASPHLNAQEARALAALLVAFADDADGADSEATTVVSWGAIPTIAEAEAHLARCKAHQINGAPWMQRNVADTVNPIVVVYLSVSQGSIVLRAPLENEWRTLREYDTKMEWRPIDAVGMPTER